MDPLTPPVDSPDDSPIPQDPLTESEPTIQTMDDIRRSIADLTESNAMDKSTALTVTRLFHGAESIIQQEHHMRVQEVSNLRHEVERTHMQAELDRLARRRTLDDQLVTPTSSKRFGR